MADGLVHSVVGGAPYYAEHGNDAADFETLVVAIDELGFGDRFVIERSTIEEDIQASDAPFDSNVCNDDLHHACETTELLTECA